MVKWWVLKRYQSLRPPALQELEVLLEGQRDVMRLVQRQLPGHHDVHLDHHVVAEVVALQQVHLHVLLLRARVLPVWPGQPPVRSVR
jgi:hypothetical protein